MNENLTTNIPSDLTIDDRKRKTVRRYTKRRAIGEKEEKVERENRGGRRK